jgi:hypothetical protein
MTRRIAGLDLLRGLAIALVMLRHALPDLAPGAGVVGVVMFFTVSGFLITGVLVDEHARTGRVNLRRFYRHRARRLVPALVALVFVVVLVTVALDPLGDRDDLVKTVVVALTWTGNLPFGLPAMRRSTCGPWQPRSSSTWSGRRSSWFSGHGAGFSSPRPARPPLSWPRCSGCGMSPTSPTHSRPPGRSASWSAQPRDCTATAWLSRRGRRRSF